MSKQDRVNKQSAWRLYFVFMAIFALFAVGLWRTWELQVHNNDRLQHQGDVRTVRNDVISAHRGNILDRNGDPLAISTPVQALVINPREIQRNPDQWPALAEALRQVGIDPEVQRNKLENSYADKEFMYVRRRMPPAEVQGILNQGFAGLYSEEEYRRFYPLGEVASHIVGLTNADDVGQEGMELAYEDWLRGTPGSKQVLKDLLGRVIREIKINEMAQPGNELQLSIDSRIQYLAYRALKEAVTMNRAGSGSAVVLDVKTGEVLALVNQPSYNPNNRSNMAGDGMRNLVVVDTVEPGSTVKPFTIAAALESGLFTTRSIINTSPGYVRVDSATIKDPINYGELTLERIITKSSQVGATHLALAMGEEPMLDVLSRVGFGKVPGSAYPGEAIGMLPNHNRWSKADIATLGYGYGFKVSPLQLAQAYLVIASGGFFKPVSLLRGVEDHVQGVRIMSPEITGEITSMMETVVSAEKGGTGVRAALPAYRVAGKSGTARIYDVARGGYDTNNHTSLFAGFLPATDPRIVIVVTVHRPQGEEYGGGAVAAPVFGRIAEGAMRILNVPPDKLELQHLELSSGASVSPMSVSSVSGAQ